MKRPVVTTLLYLAGLLICTALPGQAFAGAWAQPDNGLYVKVGVGASSASEQYNEAGETFQLLSDDIPGSFSSMAGLLYAEFGLLPQFTVFGSAMFSNLVLDSDLQRASTMGLGDLIFGFRYQYLADPVVGAVSLATKVPTGYTPDPDVMIPSLGNGVFELDARLLVGRSFYPLPFYMSAETGYRWRGSRNLGGDEIVSFSNEIPYFLEVGYAPADWIWVRGVVSGVRGLGRPQELDIFSLTPLTQRYTKVGPSVIATVFDHYQLSFDYLYTVAGLNTVRSHDIIIALAFAFGS